MSPKLSAWIQTVQQRETSIIYLQIAFRGESSAADGADKRFLSGVRALMDL